MIPFIGQDYQHRSKEVASNRLVNAYVETIEDENAKSRKIVIGTAGTQVFGDLGNYGQCRGMHTSADGTPYAVYGSSLFEINSDGSGTIRADIGGLSSFVSMADNGYYLMIADGVNLWAYGFALMNLQEVTPADFENPTHVRYLKQRFVAINSDPTILTGDTQVPNSNKIYFSEVGPDGCLTWPSLNFFSSESSADSNSGLAIAGNALWVFGRQSYEVYGVQANPDAPYSPIGGGASELGCSAPFSVSTIGGQVFWLGSSRAGKNQVFMSNGYSPQRISNHAIEYELGLISDTTDAVSFTYQQEGHTFYVLTLVGGNKTFVYDVTENYWHERTTRRKLKNVQDRWAPMFSTFAYDKVLCGFNNQEGGNSLVLELELDRYEDWDNRPIVREIQGPIMWEDLRRVFHYEFRLDMDVGHALQIGQGSVPKIMLSYADDAAHTFSSERIIDLPLIGKYVGVVAWRRLGSSRKRVYKVTFSDPIRFIVLGARLKAGGSNAY
jgi:hypothetical protein